MLKAVCLSCLGAACPSSSPRRNRRASLHALHLNRTSCREQLWSDPLVVDSPSALQLSPSSVQRRPSHPFSLLHRAPSVCAGLSRLPQQPTLMGGWMQSSYAVEPSGCGCTVAKHRSSLPGPAQETTSSTLSCSECLPILALEV